MLKIKNFSKCRLRYFPVSFFSVSLGLFGFSLVFQKLAEIYKELYIASFIITHVSFIVFIFIVIAYLIKMIYFTYEVKKEMNHPIKINFFPVFSISILLLAILVADRYPNISFILSISGAIIQYIFTIKIVSFWIYHESIKIEHINPSWFIPVVGNIIIPITTITDEYKLISLFFFIIGFMFWITLFNIFLYRAIFHSPIQEKLVPTMFILIAPPSIATISSIKLFNDIVIPISFYFVAIFLLSLLIYNIKKFIKIRFYLSWWAYSFPLSAFTIATFSLYKKLNNDYLLIMFNTFSVLLTFVIIYLVYKTAAAIKYRQICIEED